MKTFLLFIVGIIAYTASSFTPVQAAGSSRGDWVILVDQKLDTLWRTYGTDRLGENWSAKDGVITLEPGGGDLTSIKQYEDFELQLEWKLPAGSTEGNSGIMVRVVDGHHKHSYMSAVEMQILNSGEKFDKQSAGACFDLIAPPKACVKPVGEWNEVRIVVEGSHYQFFLNGVKTADFDTASPEWDARVAESKFKKWAGYSKADKGHICLQDHKHPVSFRNVRIREL